MLCTTVSVSNIKIPFTQQVIIVLRVWDFIKRLMYVTWFCEPKTKRRKLTDLLIYLRYICKTLWRPGGHWETYITLLTNILYIIQSPVIQSKTNVGETGTTLTFTVAIDRRPDTKEPIIVNGVNAVSTYCMPVGKALKSI